MGRVYFGAIDGEDGNYEVHARTAPHLDGSAVR